MIICVFAFFYWTLLVSRLLVLGQVSSPPVLNIEPNGGTLTVGLGMSQTILCYGTVDTVYTEPKWTGPENANYTTNNSRSDLPNGRTIIESKLIFNHFRLEDEGSYRCFYQASVSYTSEAMIQLIAGCSYGRYGKDCDKCSQYCKAPTDNLISPCNLINGTCVAGCREGYEGHRCDQSLEHTTTTATDTTNIDNDNMAKSSHDTDEGAVVGIVLGVVILVVVIVIVGVCCCKRRRVACFGKRKQSCVGVALCWKKKQTTEAIEEGRGQDYPMLGIQDQNAASKNESGKSKRKSGGTQPDGSVKDTGTLTSDYEKILKEKEERIQRMDEEIKKKQKENETLGSDYKKMLEEKEERIQRMDEEIEKEQQKNETLRSDYKKMLKEKEERIQRLDKEIKKKQQENDPSTSESAAMSAQPELSPRVAQKSSSVAHNIRYIFTSAIDPLSVIQLFHHYNPDVLTEKDIEHVTTVTYNNGKSEGAAQLLSRLQLYDGWFECLLGVLRNSRVKLGHVADAMEEANPSTSESAAMSAQPELSPRVAQKSSTVADKIRYIFTSAIEPLNVIHLFHKYNENVLTEKDIDHVTTVTSNKGKFVGAAELLPRLQQYKGWYQCLQYVLRDDCVKLGHVADAMEEARKSG